MKAKFTLSHGSTTQEIAEPGGWQGHEIMLERHPEFDSMIESIFSDDRFIFIGNDSEEGDGGIDFIRSVEGSGAVDEKIQLEIELAPDDATYEPYFIGLLNLEGINEGPDNQIELPIIRDDAWSKFINRIDTPVDLTSSTDLDGNAVNPVEPVSVKLTSQAIQYKGEYIWDESFTYDDNDSEVRYLIIDWDKTVRDELQKASIPRAMATRTITEDAQALAGQFIAPWDGVYTFDIRIVSADFVPSSNNWTANASLMEFRIGRAGLHYSSHQLFTDTQAGPYTPPMEGETLMISTFQGSFTLKKGEQIVIYGKSTSLDSDSGFRRTIFGQTRWSYKADDCELATTSNIVLSGEKNIDGVMTSGTRVLVKDQSDPTENGIYVSSAGAWSRAFDANSAAGFNLAAVYVTSGNTNAGTAWKQVNTITSLPAEIKWEYLTPSDERFQRYPPTASLVSSYCNVTADTIFPETEVEGYWLHDVFDGIARRISDYRIYSEVLGSTITTARQYGSDGCYSNFLLLKGLHIRGYTLSDKPFFMSFKECWEGANPIFSLALGDEIVSDERVIRIEGKDHFYSTISTSVNFDDVYDIVRSYDKDRIFKKVTVGYNKWESEDAFGLDDPNTKHVYATRLSSSGKELPLLSNFISSGLAIERTRRTSIDKSIDYKYDNDTFIIAINTSGSEPYVPELNENFTSVTGVLNPDSRYNLILTPLRNLLRWRPYILGCLQSYLTSKIMFVSGEGNFDMESEYDCSNGLPCQAVICDNISEGGDIDLSTYGVGFGYLHLPTLYEIRVPMSWEEYKAIRNDPKKAIGISQTNTGHAMFLIKQLNYNPTRGTAVIQAWSKEFFEIKQIDVMPEMGCQTDDPTTNNALLLESGDYILLESGDVILLED